MRASPQEVVFKVSFIFTSPSLMFEVCSGFSKRVFILFKFCDMTKGNCDNLYCVGVTLDFPDQQIKEWISIMAMRFLLDSYGSLGTMIRVYKHLNSGNIENV